MAIRSFRNVVSGACIVLCFLLAAQWVYAQESVPSFDSSAVEAATAISGGLCSNSTIGISYKLPPDMKAEDAAAMRRFAYHGSANRGISPEARYFLWGYSERKTLAMVCGAANETGQVTLIAGPLSVFKAQGPNVVDKLVEGFGQELHAHPSALQTKTVNGLKLKCADFQTELNSPVRGKVDIRATACAAVVNSYIVMWNLIGYSDAEWKRLNADLNSVKSLPPQPLKAATASQPPSGNPGEPTDPGFQARLQAFIKAWLADRNTNETMDYFDRSAYSAPPLIGNYCGGWYQMGWPPKQVARYMSENLMGVPKEFPKETQAPAIFSAWKLFPPAWLSVSANEVPKDHYLVVRLDKTSLDHIFSGVFADSDYGKYLRKQIRNDKSAYWVVFPERAPDGDLFVIFTLWQQSGKEWKITDMDVICQ
jgi:hypothetical protein